jgi:hypothetical protein
MVTKRPRKPVIHIVRVFAGTQEPYSIPDGVAEALMHCVGMEYTQAKNCEYMIMHSGVYSVHHTTDLERAGLIIEALREEGLNCTLLHR